MRYLIFVLLISQLSFSQLSEPVDSFDPNKYYHAELFQLTPKTSLTYTKFEETIFPGIRHAEVLVLLESELTERTSFLFGNKIDFFGTKKGFIPSLTKISASTGIQYETRNGAVQGLFNYQLNRPRNANFLSNGFRPSFNLRTRF